MSAEVDGDWGSTADSRTIDGSRLKVALLTEGLQVSEGIWLWLRERRRKLPHRVRSGSCGGLDLVLADGTVVNAPCLEAFAARSTYSLQLEAGAQLVLAQHGRPVSSVEVPPEPEYYDSLAPSGLPLRQIGQVCSDRVGVGLTNACRYWRSKEARCRFCSIGANSTTEQGNKRDEDVLAVVTAALGDAVAPARHVLLGGGTPEGRDAGGLRIAEITRALRSEHPLTPVYAMLAPPDDLGVIDLLHDAGVTEVGINIEVFSDDAARKYIPGKAGEDGRMTYWRALRRAVDTFGPIRTRSIVVVGLEGARETVEGVRQLAVEGVMPILSPLRPLQGTALGHLSPPTPDEAWSVLVDCLEAVDGTDVPLGPTCISCQSNTLTVSGHGSYRWY